MSGTIQVDLKKIYVGPASISTNINKIFQNNARYCVHNVSLMVPWCDLLTLGFLSKTEDN